MTKRMTTAKVRDRIRAECLEAGSATAWAKENGVSANYVSLVMNAKMEPGPAILNALGLKRVILYEQKEETDG